MTDVWNEQYRALHDRTYRLLYDAGIDEKLADELATQRTLAVALRLREQRFPFHPPQRQLPKAAA